MGELRTATSIFTSTNNLKCMQGYTRIHTFARVQTHKDLLAATCACKAFAMSHVSTSHSCSREARSRMCLAKVSCGGKQYSCDRKIPSSSQQQHKILPRTSHPHRLLGLQSSESWKIQSRPSVKSALSLHNQGSCRSARNRCHHVIVNRVSGYGQHTEKSFL